MIKGIMIELRPEFSMPDVVSLKTAVKLSGSANIVRTQDFIRFDDLEPMIEMYMEKATREIREYLRIHREDSERKFKSVAEIELAITKLLRETQ